MPTLARHEALTIAVVIVTHESAAVVGSCLAALDGIADLEVVLVDNASTDPTVDIARRQGLSVTAFDRNRGFATAANAGARIATATRLCFLNPDCVLTSECVAAARSAWQARPDAVLVPDFLQYGTRVTGRQPGYSRAKLLVDLLEMRQAMPRLRARLRRRPTYHDRRWHWPLGTCVFVPRRVFDAVGGFDEGYFLYMEDCEFGAAVHATGGDVLSLPIVLEHLGGGSSAISSDRRLALLEAARLRWAAVHYGRQTAWAFRVMLAALGRTRP